MSECTWVALIEDKETGEVKQRHFRYYAFASEEEARMALQEELYYIYNVLEVSTNPYQFKNIV